MPVFTGPMPTPVQRPVSTSALPGSVYNSVVPRSVYPTTVHHWGSYNTWTGRSWQNALAWQPRRDTYAVPFVAPWGGLRQGQFFGRKLAQWGPWGGGSAAAAASASSFGPFGGATATAVATSSGGGAAAAAAAAAGGGGGGRGCNRGRRGCAPVRYYGNPYGRWGR
jgi:hypothetical protein